MLLVLRDPSGDDAGDRAATRVRTVGPGAYDSCKESCGQEDRGEEDGQEAGAERPVRQGSGCEAPGPPFAGWKSLVSRPIAPGVGSTVASVRAATPLAKRPRQLHRRRRCPSRQLAAEFHEPLSRIPISLANQFEVVHRLTESFLEIVVSELIGSIIRLKGFPSEREALLGALGETLNLIPRHNGASTHGASLRPINKDSGVGTPVATTAIRSSRCVGPRRLIQRVRVHMSLAKPSGSEDLPKTSTMEKRDGGEGRR